MSKSAQLVAEEIQDILRRNAKDVVTFSWPDFYKVAERARLKDAFTTELTKKLRELGFLVSYGQAVVLVGKDFKFANVKVS